MPPVPHRPALVALLLGSTLLAQSAQRAPAPAASPAGASTRAGAAAQSPAEPAQAARGTGAAPERSQAELRAEAARLEAGIDKQRPEARVPLADWMLRQGLATDALHQLDLVLAADPDQHHALALLERLAARVNMPGLPTAADVQAQRAPQDAALALRAAARLPAAAREIALGRLARVLAPELWRAALAKESVSRDASVRAAAVLGLRRSFQAQELELLLARAILDGNPAVRREAQRGLRAAEDPVVVAPALRALGSKSAMVRANAAETIGNLGYREALPALMAAAPAALQSSGSGSYAPRASFFHGRQLAYIQDFDVEVATGQSIADPQVNVLSEGEVLDVRVISIGEEVAPARVEPALVGAFEKLAGAQHGPRAKDWLAWWQLEGQRWIAENLAAPRTGSAPAGA